MTYHFHGMFETSSMFTKVKNVSNVVIKRFSFCHCTEETYVAYSKEECEKMVLALSGSLARLPAECKQYVGASKSKVAKTSTKVVDPFEGMYSGQRTAAQAAAVKGRPTQAVLQRRYTRAPK